MSYPRNGPKLYAYIRVYIRIYIYIYTPYIHIESRANIWFEVSLALRHQDTRVSRRLPQRISPRRLLNSGCCACRQRGIGLRPPSSLALQSFLSACAAVIELAASERRRPWSWRPQSSHFVERVCRQTELFQNAWANNPGLWRSQIEKREFSSLLSTVSLRTAARLRAASTKVSASLYLSIFFSRFTFAYLPTSQSAYKNILQKY